MLKAWTSGSTNPRAAVVWFGIWIKEKMCNEKYIFSEHFSPCPSLPPSPPGPSFPSLPPPSHPLYIPHLWIIGCPIYRNFIYIYHNLWLQVFYTVWWINALLLWQYHCQLLVKCPLCCLQGGGTQERNPKPKQNSIQEVYDQRNSL